MIEAETKIQDQETEDKETTNDNPKTTNKKGTKEKKNTKIKKVVIEDPDLPEKLSAYISEEIWKSWSPIRKESFKQIITNPNSFFYRNRPPGDPHKLGGFSEAEEKQFLERLDYFKKLGVEGFWGLFSVPILGRVGYQCSNFYRALIKEKKIIDSHYQVDEEGKIKYSHGKVNVDPEVIKILEKEAFDFIEQCLKPENGEIPQVTSQNVESYTTKRPKTPKDSRPQIIYSNKKLPYAVFDGFGRARSLGDRLAHTVVPREIVEWDGNQSPYFGAPDPLTGNPIIKPMADSNYFVMDLESWRLVFDKEAKSPVPTPAFDEGDLTEITMDNFDSLKLMVKNIVC